MKQKILFSLCLLVLSCVGSGAFAQSLICGKDLRATLDKQTLEEIAQAGDNVPNGHGRFWKIEKQGVEPSWLLGTMHAGDAEVVKMSPAESEAFNKADRVALELTEIADETGQSLMRVMMADPKTLMYQDDDSIKKQLSEKEFQKFEAALKNHGLSYIAIQRMKPWFIWAALATPNCPEPKGKALSKPFDMVIGLKALGEGKELVGLETAQEQVDALTKLPDSFYIKSIQEILDNEEMAKDQFTTMGKLYIEGNIGEIVALFDYYSKENLTTPELQEFNTILLHQRNALMAKRAAPLLEKGNSFIAVGALHLVDETGLVEAFRHQGYEVTAVK